MARPAHPQPLIDLRLFANKVFSASIVTMILMILAVFGGMLLLPIYLQTVRFESALDTGLLLAPRVSAPCWPCPSRASWPTAPASAASCPSASRSSPAPSGG
ncbi:hypothetical protein ACFQV8_22710 [Pseudonocardia benzenivorans]